MICLKRFESYEIIWLSSLLGAAIFIWPDRWMLFFVASILAGYFVDSKLLFVVGLIVGMMRIGFSFWITAEPIEISNPIQVHISEKSGWYSVASSKDFNFQMKAMQVGFDLTGTAYLKPISTYQLSLPFIKERVLFEKKIIGKIKWTDKPGKFYAPSILESIRTRAESFMQSRFASLSGFRKAMFLGDGSGMPTEIWEKLNFLGLSHAIVISGSHLTALSLILIFLFAFMSRFFPWMKIPTQKLLVTGGILFFSIVCGLEVSLLRASLCFLLTSLFSYLFPSFHRISNYKKLASVGTLFFLASPLDCFRPSYGLSFASSWALLRTDAKISSISSLAVFAIIFSVAALFGMKIHPLSPLCNLLLLPILFFLLVPLSLLTLLIPALEQVGNSAIVGYYVLIKKSAELLSLIPVPPGPPIWFAFSSLCAVIILLIQRDLSLFKKIGGLSLITIFLFLSPILNWHDSQQKYLTLDSLDIGQGDAFLLNWNKSSVVIDGGSDFSAQKKFLPAIYGSNQKIDVWVLSHFDRDHMGAFKKVSQFINFEEVWIPRRDLKKLDTSDFKSIRSVEKRDLYYCDQSYCLLSWIDPKRKNESRAVTNADSLVLFLIENKTKELRAVFLGDLEGPGEEALLEFLTQQRIFKVNERIDLLKVAHHGSRSSSKINLLQFLKPAIAIISCGRHNQYGHPHEETLERLEAVDAAVLRTDVLGDFKVFF